MYQTICEYLEYLEIEKGLSQNTLNAYRCDLEDFCDVFDIYDAEEVDRITINNYIRKLKENKFAASSVIRKVASLRGFFKWAYST